MSATSAYEPETPRAGDDVHATEGEGSGAEIIKLSEGCGACGVSGVDRETLMAAATSICFTPPSLTPAPLRVDPQRAPPGSLSDANFGRVNELRALIESSLAAESCLGRPWSAGGRAEAEAHTDDFTLMRYTIARPKSLEEALRMFHESMEWRSDKNVQRLFCELHPLAPPCARLLARNRFYFGGPGGIARDGSAYFVMRVGAMDLAGLARESQVLDVMMDADAANLELVFRTVRACSAATGSFQRTLCIVDVAGFSLTDLAHISVAKRVMKIGPQIFPEGASKVLIVNAPLVFAAAWKLVSPFLPERSRNKCEILSSWATPAALAEYIEPEQLPAFLGGEQKEDAPATVGRAEQVPTDHVIDPEGEAPGAAGSAAGEAAAVPLA